MKDSVPAQDTAASRPTVPRTRSRGNLRLIQTATPSLSSDEHAHESPTQRINHNVDLGDPPLTILVW
jgi:hypothetical protein